MRVSLTSFIPTQAYWVSKIQSEMWISIQMGWNQLHIFCCCYFWFCTNANIINSFRRYALQPGCWTIVCAHSRSYEYYAETVRPGNENNFIATRCNSFSSFKNGKCSGRPIPMGINTPPTARGSYYLHTNKKSPFGMKLRSIGRYVKSVANNILHNANAENEEK